MTKALLLFIVLIFSGLACYHALSGHSCSYLTACSVLAFPFFVLLFLLSLMQLTGSINRNFISSGTAVVVSVFVALIVFEGILRALKINVSYTERIGQKQYQSPYAVDKSNSFWLLYPPHDSTNIFRGDFYYKRLFNSLGLAEREVNLKDTSTKKILCLGDSFTEGVGTGEDSTWPRVVERGINLCSADSYTVYNAGVAGGDPMYNYHLLRGKLWDVKWDAVVFCVNATDISDVIFRGGMERFNAGDKVEFNKPPVWEPLFGTLYIVRFLMLDILRYNWKLHPISEADRLNNEAASKISNVLLQAHDELSKKGIEMMVVILPLNYNVSNRAYVEGMDSVKSNLTLLKPVDMLPYFLDSAGITERTYTNFYWPSDGHLNAAGYNVVGRKVANELMKRLNIKCKKQVQ